MDTERCSVCEQTAAFACRCSAGPVYLCVSCIQHHAETPGQHTLRKIEAAAPSQQTLLRLETGFLCQFCRDKIAGETCTCVFPMPLMCEDCRVDHMAGDMYAEHNFLPVEVYQRVKSEQQWGVVRDGLVKVGLAEDACKESLRNVAKCGEVVEKRHGKLVRRLDEEKRLKLEALARKKTQLVSSLAKAIQDFKTNLLHESFSPTSVLAQKIGEFMRSEDDSLTVDLFSYEVEDDPEKTAQAVSDLFGVTWTSVEEEKQAPKPAVRTPAKPAPPPTTCLGLIGLLKQRLSTAIQEFVPETHLSAIKTESEEVWRELTQEMEALMKDLAAGRHHESIPSIDIEIERKSTLRTQLLPLCSTARAKVAWLALGETLFAQTPQEYHSDALRYKKQIMEAIEAGLDSMFLTVQLNRANSTSESKEKQLFADLLVLEKAARRSEVPANPSYSPSIGQPRQSMQDGLPRAGSLSLSQLLEMKKFNFGDENLRNIEKAVMNTNETLNAAFKVLAALGNDSLQFETVERLVDELIPCTATQCIPFGHVKCLYEALRRRPQQPVPPFELRTSPYDDPQELCSFLLSEKPQSSLSFTLAAVNPESLHLFDCRTHCWTSVPLNPPIRVDSKSSYVFQPAGALFVCGGVWQKTVISDTYEISPTARRVVHLSDMQSARSCHGLIQCLSAVYCFGGMGAKPMKSCEKFKMQWETLPSEMYCPRFGLNPCEYRHSIYLIGGNSPDAEILDLLSETFSRLSLSLPEVSNSCSCAIDEDFVVLTTHKVVRWGSRQRGVVGAHKKFCAWGNMKPVVYGEEVFMVMLDCVCLQEKRGVQRVDLRTGEIVGFAVQG